MSDCLSVAIVAAIAPTLVAIAAIIVALPALIIALRNQESIARVEKEKNNGPEH